MPNQKGPESRPLPKGVFSDPEAHKAAAEAAAKANGKATPSEPEGGIGNAIGVMRKGGDWKPF